MSAQHDQGSRNSISRAIRGSSLVQFGALTLTLLGALFWARQKLISPTPRMAMADPQAAPSAPSIKGTPMVAAPDR